MFAEEIVINRDDATGFAIDLDPLLPHRGGGGNLVLPAEAASGYYLLCLVNKMIVEHQSYQHLQCGSRLEVSWLKATKLGEKLRVAIQWDDRPQINGADTYKRDTQVEVSNTAKEIVLRASMVHHMAMEF